MQQRQPHCSGQRPLLDLLGGSRPFASALLLSDAVVCSVPMSYSLWWLFSAVSSAWRASLLCRHSSSLLPSACSSSWFTIVLGLHRCVLLRWLPLFAPNVGHAVFLLLLICKIHDSYAYTNEKSVQRVEIFSATQRHDQNFKKTRP